MGETVSNNRFGLHWANVHISDRLMRLALSMGGDCYLVMDGGSGCIPKIREARPNAIIVQRHAVSNWMDMDPKEWASQMAELFHNHQQWTRHIELECEPDIFPNFPGWGQPIVDRLKFAAEWNIRVAKRVRELCPGVIIHSPPLAHERLELPDWFEIWKPVLDVCDVLDMHCYWEKDGKYFKPGLYDPKESYHRAFRYRKIHDFLESQDYHVPMMVTECGNFAPDLPEYDIELIYYFYGLEEDAHYMIGGCVFILKSNVHNWVNDLTRQPNIEEFFNGIGSALKETLPYPSKEPKEEPMDIWESVPSQIAQWKELVGRVTREYPVPIPDYQGIAVSPAKVVACIIRRESNGDPNIVNPDSGATGLMQIMPFHFEEGRDPKDPDWNVRKGLSIFAGKIAKAQDLYRALFWYSGKAGRPEAPFIEEYWEPFVAWYKEFWGVDLEPDGVDYKKKYEGLRNGVVAAIRTLQAVVDA